MKQSSSLDLSIIVPLYRGEICVLSRCLNSIRESFSGDNTFEVILVESGPAPLQPKQALEGLPSKYHYSSDRCFVGKARNLGAQMASFKNLWFLDSDCIVNSTWRDEYLRVRNQDWTACCGYLAFEDHKQRAAYAFHLWEFHEFLGSRVESKRFAIGCNLLIRKQFLLASNSFLSNWSHCEDFEFFSRAKVQASAKIKYFPKLSITHQSHLTAEDKLLNKSEFMGLKRCFYDLQLNSFQISNRRIFKLLGRLTPLAFTLLCLKRLLSSCSKDFVSALSLSGYIFLFSKYWYKGWASKQANLEEKFWDKKR